MEKTNKPVNPLVERFYEIESRYFAAQVEKLGLRVDMLEQYPAIRRQRLDGKIQKQLELFDRKNEKELFRLELEAIEPEAAFKKSNAKTIEELDKKYRLKFREFRQNLRRDEGIVDKENNLIGTLSAHGEEKLREFEAALETEKLNILKEKSEQFVKNESAKGDRAKAVTLFEKRRKEVAEERESVRLEAEKKAEKTYNAFTEANHKETAGIKEKLAKTKERAKIAASRVHTLSLPPEVAMRLENLSMQFGGLRAVDNLSFDVMRGEIFGLIGPNGAGKTTVFNCITQFYKPTSGEIWFNDRYGETLRLNKLSVHNIIKTVIVRTFQNIELVAELTILENLLIAAHTQYHSGFFSHMFNTSSLKWETEVLKSKAHKILEKMRLLSLKDNYPVGLPYGVLKRIELARTLMANASLIILDEPAAGLNEKETEDLTILIRDIAREYDATIFLVEHDMGLVMDVCDHICAISFGKKLAYGTPKEIQDSKDVQEAYLGVE